jgi:DNA-binding SARP family transcriptional activator/tetratricopeptide (TPR) repeat protein
MEFRVLGPLNVVRSGTATPVSGDKQRALLAALLLEPNTPVSKERLFESLWGQDIPPSADASLHNHVMRLRRQLGPEGDTLIRAVAPGFLLQIGPGQLDAREFAERCAAGQRAGRAGQPARAARLFAEALALWNGTPFADVPGLDPQDPRVQQLHETRLRAFEGRIEADLNLGRHHELIGELRTLVAEHPLREGLYGQLMLALFRADRQAEALETYRGLRQTLIERLGVEPAASLRQLHQRILNADPALAAPQFADSEPAAPDLAAAQLGAPGPEATGPEPAETQPAAAQPADADPARTDPAAGPPVAAPIDPRRHQLPADIRAFTGRTRELDRLVELARRAPEGTASGLVLISAIDGMAGIGKTTLALRLAHLVRADFPDGQLFLDLHGHTPGLAPLAAADCLERLLVSLGVPVQDVPADPEERAALYRHKLAGTRTLIILDNAADGLQVRSLLPDTAGCLLLITSRRRLTGLDDTHSVTLDLLTTAEAITLLHLAAGPDRIAVDHPAVGELVALCGHLPLAIRITGARLRQRRSLSIDTVLGQLREANTRLARLQDSRSNLTAALCVSYQALSPAEQHLLRCLGQVPGADFDSYAAANLIGSDLRAAERLLESLLDHSLLTTPATGRYGLHDLVRLYARTLRDEDTDAGTDFGKEAETALDRLLYYYEHTARTAQSFLIRHVRPGGAPPDAAAPRPAPAVAPDLPDRDAGLRWLRAERGNIFACAETAGPAQIVALASALSTFLRQDGRWETATRLQTRAIEAALEIGDRRGEADARSALAGLLSLIGEQQASLEHDYRALAIYEELGDEFSQALALTRLGQHHLDHSECAPALELLERAEELYRRVGDHFGEAVVLWKLSVAWLELAQYTKMIDALERALAIFQAANEVQGEVLVLSDLARAHFYVGDFQTSADQSGRVLAIYQDLSNLHGMTSARFELGRVRLATGDLDAAEELFDQALAGFQELGGLRGIANTRGELGKVRYARGDLAAAGQLQREALAHYLEIDHRPCQAEALLDLGRVRHATAAYEEAAELFDRALVIVRDLHDRRQEADTLISVGDLAADTAGPNRALGHYERALQIAQEIGSPMSKADALAGRARCAERTGAVQAALADLREAVALYRNMGAAQTAAAEVRLARLEQQAQLDR